MAYQNSIKKLKTKVLIQIEYPIDKWDKGHDEIKEALLMSILIGGGINAIRQIYPNATVDYDKTKELQNKFQDLLYRINKCSDFGEFETFTKHTFH